MVQRKPTIPHHLVGLQHDSQRHVVEAEASQNIQQLIQNFEGDFKDLSTFYNITFSTTRVKRLREYLEGVQAELASFPYDDLDTNGQVDWHLIQRRVKNQLKDLKSAGQQIKELEPLLESWSPPLVQLCESRQKVVKVDWRLAAESLSNSESAISHLEVEIASGKLGWGGGKGRFVAYRAAEAIDELRGHLNEWYAFYAGYDPMFSWWLEQPSAGLHQRMTDLVAVIRDKLVGDGDKDAIVGQPSGRESILADLEAEIIAYSPEELIAIAEKEYEWCEREMKSAAHALGYDDWRETLEHVKNTYVDPGQQIHLVHDLANEAVEYVTKHDMVTVPRIAAETWQTFMMKPERQKVNPFFLGGESIIVSYPTNTMSHKDKMMSMRGNNPAFSRSTVFHELIPGHHLQFYYMDRFRPYRRIFDTPFWVEGWAFYWEFILWDRGFPYTPEYKLGMLFWRMHRCARIVFSLKFHLGEMTPQECIEYLVEKVGHERFTAEGEVRRSFNGDYNPLYQAGYMLGALQFYALRTELVDKGGMREKDFHDQALKANMMPIELLRALLTGRRLERDAKPSWRFYDA